MIGESSRGTEARWTGGAADCPAGVRARAERPNQLELSIASGVARLHRSYAWGLDASGTLTGAGGVGGLLLTTHYGTAGNSNVTLAPLYDFNSNVLAYADVTTSTITHRIDYDPFGNELTLDTLLPAAAAEEAPRFRFSTKYTDSESGLVYYGFRSYSPELGRWVNRDPIEERGGVNLYGMVGNDAVNRWDKLGLEFTGTYSITDRTLDLTDNARKVGTLRKSLATCSCPASSGDNDPDNQGKQGTGPIPEGSYTVYHMGNRISANTTLLLDPVDSNQGNDEWDGGTNRTFFRIHLADLNDPTGRRGSNGCIVLEAIPMGELNAFLEATRPGPLTQITQDPRHPDAEVFRLYRYGTLTVTR
jgi:RHS repeat-associated protein